jgi:hypothetical protein
VYARALEPEFDPVPDRTMTSLPRRPTVGGLLGTTATASSDAVAHALQIIAAKKAKKAAVPSAGPFSVSRPPDPHVASATVVSETPPPPPLTTLTHVATAPAVPIAEIAPRPIESRVQHPSRDAPNSVLRVQADITPCLTSDDRQSGVFPPRTSLAPQVVACSVVPFSHTAAIATKISFVPPKHSLAPARLAADPTAPVVPAPAINNPTFCIVETASKSHATVRAIKSEHAMFRREVARMLQSSSTALNALSEQVIRFAREADRRAGILQSRENAARADLDVALRDVAHKDCEIASLHAQLAAAAEQAGDLQARLSASQDVARECKWCGLNRSTSPPRSAQRNIHVSACLLHRLRVLV